MDKKRKKRKKKVDKGLHIKKGKTSLAQMEEAIRASGGYLSQVAETLGITRQAVWKRIKNSTRLQEAKKDVEESYLDFAESKLIKAVKDGKAWAICFYLKCKGKHRGYVERQEFAGVEGKPIPLDIKIERAERVKSEDKEG